MPDILDTTTVIHIARRNPKALAWLSNTGVHSITSVTYLEIMQERGVPESEIKAYLQLKKLFLTVQ